MTEKEKALQEIETKQLGILSVEKCRRKLTSDEEYLFNHLTKKWRDKKGKLLKGSFYVGSKSKWVEVLE